MQTVQTILNAGSKNGDYTFRREVSAVGSGHGYVSSKSLQNCFHGYQDVECLRYAQCPTEPMTAQENATLHNFYLLGSIDSRNGGDRRGDWIDEVFDPRSDDMGRSTVNYGCVRRQPRHCCCDSRDRNVFIIGFHIGRSVVVIMLFQWACRRPHHHHGTGLSETISRWHVGLPLSVLDGGLSVVGWLLREGVVLVARWWHGLWVMGRLLPSQLLWLDRGHICCHCSSACWCGSGCRRRSGRWRRDVMKKSTFVAIRTGLSVKEVITNAICDFPFGVANKLLALSTVRLLVLGLGVLLLKSVPILLG